MVLIHICVAFMYHVWLLPQCFLMPEATFKGHASPGDDAKHCRMNFSSRLLVTVCNGRKKKQKKNIKH